MHLDFPSLVKSIASTQKNKYEPLARAHIDNLTKPQGSLGQIEDIATQIYTIFKGVTPLCVEPALHIVAAADHGVYAEKIASYPQEITHQMILNILNGGAAISVLTKFSHMDMWVVDAGHIGSCEAPCISIGKYKQSGNIAKEAAMSYEEAIRLMLCGANLVNDAVSKGYKLISIGEMGIGNTSPATALFCALYGFEASHITGPGAGLDEAGIRHKAKVIETALNFHKEIIKNGNPIEILAHLGGFEIATLCGVVLGAAAHQLPVLIDGFISTSAYAVAHAICRHVHDYAIMSHVSAEPAYTAIIEKLDKKPLLDLSMRLGEGTGCALAMNIVQASLIIFNDMATFDGAGVSNKE